MRILHIHTKLVSGGIEAIVCGLANEMVKSHDVTVCTIFEPHDDDVFYSRLKPEVKKITCGKKNFGFSIKEIFDITRLFLKGNYDVIHVHGCFQYYALAALLCHSKVKIFYTIHSDAIKENQTWDKRLFVFKKFCFKHRWIRPVTISKSSQRSFEALYGCNSDMVENGVAESQIKCDFSFLNKYRKTENTLLFFHAGRISEPKNQVVLCQVFQSIINKGNDVVLIIAGMKEDKTIFSSIEKYLGERIIYIGEQKNVPQLMYEADAFCLPSIWEGLPVTLLESLSVGCIPICSPVGGIVDVIDDGQNGFLSHSSDKEDYENKIEYFVKLNKTERERIKINAKNSFQKYNIITTASKYLEIYDN